MVWSDDLHLAVHAGFTGERLGFYADFGDPGLLARALAEGFAFQGEHSLYRGGPRGKPAPDLDPRAMVVFLQNHDLSGNRPQGERFGHLVREDAARLAALLVLTAPQTPMLFMGEEWNAAEPFQFFTDYGDPYLVDCVRKGRRHELKRHGWAARCPDPQARRTWERSCLDWSTLDHEPHARMLAWYRRLLALRGESPFDTAFPGCCEARALDDTTLLVLRRAHPGEALQAALLANLAPRKKHPLVELPEGSWELVVESPLAPDLPRRLEGGTARRVALPAWAGGWWRRAP